MKPLTALRNVDKAKLLHNLFPEEIPALLQYVKGMAMTLREHEADNRTAWQENGLFSFDMWLQLAQQAENTLNKYGKQLERNANVFADQLFDGYGAAFMVHCIIQYTTQKTLPNTAFVLGAKMLFNPS